MLWRVRTTLPDRRKALAALAEQCGEAGVHILGLQILPGVEAVIDELVLGTPDGWGSAEIAVLVEGSGGHSVTSALCTEAALTDQPARYVLAARAILAQQASFPEILARLFDAEVVPAGGRGGRVHVMDVTVGDVQMQVRRAVPFTATEHARAAAMADLVTGVLERSRDVAPAPERAHRPGPREGAPPAARLRRPRLHGAGVDPDRPR